jgi:hypothetical protein
MILGLLIPFALFLSLAFVIASIAFSLRERKFQRI